jgi:hypothetical protein
MSTTVPALVFCAAVVATGFVVAGWRSDEGPPVDAPTPIEAAPAALANDGWERFSSDALPPPVPLTDKKQVLSTCRWWLERIQGFQRVQLCIMGDIPACRARRQADGHLVFIFDNAGQPETVVLDSNDQIQGLTGDAECARLDKVPGVAFTPADRVRAQRFLRLLARNFLGFEFHNCTLPATDDDITVKRQNDGGWEIRWTERSGEFGANGGALDTSPDGFPLSQSYWCGCGGGRKKPPPPISEKTEPAPPQTNN